MPGRQVSKRAGAPLLTYYVGEKKAHEMIFMSREYTAREAEAMGLINKVVPDDELYPEVERWCRELPGMNPTSLRMLKVLLDYKGELACPATWHAREMLDLFTGTEERRRALPRGSRGEDLVSTDSGNRSLRQERPCATSVTVRTRLV